MLKRSSLLVCLVLAGTAGAHAQSRLTGFGLLRLEASARAAALSGAHVASPGADATVLFYNPALLTEEHHRQIAVSYLNHVADINAGFFSYVEHARPLGGPVGIAVRYLSYGDFERADEEGNTDGTFGAHEAVVSVSHARPVAERVRVGGTIHAAFSSIDDASAQALAADVGVTYVVPERELAFSASLHHVGFVTKSLGTTDDALPVDLRVSVSKRLTYVPLLITVTGYDLTRFENETGTALNELARHVALGAELSFGRPFALRVGYNHRQHQDLKTDSRIDLAGLGLGFGLNLRRFGFDYAYNAWSSFGGLHQLTLRARL